MLQGAFAVRGVCEEDLVTHPLVKVEQGKLGAGVRALATHDDACAVRVTGEVDHAGQLRDLRPGSQGAVLLQRGVPDVLGQSPDRAADRLGDGMSDREEGTDPSGEQGAYVVQECFGASGAVGADE